MWLGELPQGETDWDRCAALAPAAFDALGALLAAAWQQTDARLLELARLRVAALLRHHGELQHRSAPGRAAGVSDDEVAALDAWHTSALFDARDRACLLLTEQLVLDANTVTDAMVADVTAFLGSKGCYEFVQAVSVQETFQRACLTLGITTRPPLEALAPLPPESPR